MTKCHHNKVTCLNQYELIRKYKCGACNEVMMCSCDKEHGERFRPHQLKQGRCLESQEKVPVTLGFQENICLECRGEIPVSAPKSPMPGYTTKITRYYWREIALETTRRFYDKHPQCNPNDHMNDEFSFPEERKIIEKEVINELKKKHDIAPKYDYEEPSQSEIIKLTNTDVILINAKHVTTDDRKVRIESENQLLTVEKFASNYFQQKGYSTIETESIPFHVLFGVYMWPLIQDPDDPHNRIVGFDCRTEFDNNSERSSKINTFLPSDFGTEGYFHRRKFEIEKHISELRDLKWLFDYWLHYSNDFRQYLYAHREKDINIAKTIIDILSESDIKSILHYLSRNYWANYCGWPDLLVFNNSGFLFVEVKSSNDKLSVDQKNWLLGNNKYMSFESKIFKVAKQDEKKRSNLSN